MSQALATCAAWWRMGFKSLHTACTLPRWSRLVAEGIQRVRRHSDGAPIHNLLPLAAAVAAGVLRKHQLLLAAQLTWDLVS